MKNNLLKKKSKEKSVTKSLAKSIAKEKILKNNFLYSTIILEGLRRNGVKNFIISPGHRCAPLVWAINYIKKRDASIISIPAIDERAGAYLALAASKASNNVAAVLICTSGTALANYYPAIIEAYRDQIPLIILSADRPLEMVNSDANQTIDQNQIYSKYSKANLNMLPADSDYPIEALVREIDQIFATAHAYPSAPIHINVPFREPLWNNQRNALLLERFVEKKLKQIYKNNFNKIVKIIRPSTYLSEIAPTATTIANAKKILIVVGRLKTTCNLKPIVEMINFLSENKITYVYYDVLSSLRYARYSLNFENDFVLNFLSEKKHSPDLILHLGGRVLSNGFYKYLTEKNKESNYILINEYPNKQDPVHRVNLKIELALDVFCLQAINYFKKINFKKVEYNKINKIEKIKLDHPDDENLIFKNLVQEISNQCFINDHILYLANSLTIRLFNRYLPNKMNIGKMNPNKNKELKIISNRGVSGIEGFMASSIGYAISSKKAVTLVIGDLAMIHDLNSLIYLNANFLKEYNLYLPPLIIIILNNFGGGIFKTLPVVNAKGEVDKHISTPHNFSFENFFKTTDVNYFSFKISQIQSLKKSIHNIYKISQESKRVINNVCVLEIITKNT
ncbi:MAG: 2-succinyl-5-enolpyruvyl-6-hydroxy-3-cyclohexene-1-carboxylic-acid synthase [Oligoflexia bacterium]|nr:2-succinyl-5-enolpyruvyl-6-hydroxy-3-cyclohexene-1-carboxylic-acid synthase [Oligoflexia bacterium]